MDCQKKNRSLSDKTMDTFYPHKGHFREMEASASPIDSGTSPLTFTFVPSIGTLPSEVLLAKKSIYPSKIVGHKGTWMQKHEDINAKSMYESPQTIFNTIHKPTYRGSFLQEEFALNTPENTKHNDLFIAEFVVVMDSDDDENRIIASKPKILPFEEGKYEFSKTLQQSTTGQPKETVTIVEDCRNEDCHNVDDQKPQQICSMPSVGLESYSPQSSHFSYPDRKTQGYIRQITASVPANIDKPKAAVKDTFHTPLSSQKSNSFNTLSTESQMISNTRRSLYSPSHLEMSEHNTSNISQNRRSNVLSPLPIQVIKYPLCHTPSPLSSPFFGSSSTICSMNECTSPVPNSGAVSPVSSRLSFLTSLLKSKRSCPKRTISPDQHYKAEPKTTSIISSSEAHRKAISCISLNYPRESKMSHFQKTAEIMPSASESDILHGKFSFHQSSNKKLSTDPVHFQSSESALHTQKGSVSPSFHLHCRSVTPPNSSREYISSYSDKPPISRPCTPIKKYPVLGKSKRVTLFPPPSHFDRTFRHLPDERKSNMPCLKRYTSPRSHFKSTTHASNENLHPSNVLLSSPMDMGKHHGLHQAYSAPLPNENMETDQVTYQSLHPSLSWKSFSSEELSRKHVPLCITTQPRSILSRSYELQSGSSLPLVSDLENKKLYKIKSRYKAFAAIPTNTLLLDQKAFDEPVVSRRSNEAEDKRDTHTEMCSPALLRQQTEEICAAIDEVLHDPMPLHCNLTSRSPKLKSEKKSAHKPRPPMKSAGRETKYASLQSLINKNATDPQMTRPGVIRPLSAQENNDRKLHPNLFQQYSMPPYKRE
ncbi:muscular LMNA-interacting protein [Hyla sarda]|uniref:muscular LMNA-interacting protein n=1 Tax=Hyla sarda TaxID=327740 RepID=UPI0024C355C2|nr:muscular LMNA-interacting protein [Hyla sarda]